MQIVILAIGKKHDPRLADALDHYQKMLGSDAPEWILLDSKASTSGDKHQAKQAEAALLMQRLKPNDTVVAMDEHGTQLSSPELAAKLHEYQVKSTKQLVLVIGGAFGLDKSITSRADFVWSLSKLVFPHQLVRLILAEQLYRAASINAGKQYHY